jgi:uncharacterized protein (TIGR00369 family)
MPASPWLQTQAGFFLNGTSALVADFALGGAIGSALPPWTVPVTSDLNFTYLRPIRVDADKLIAQARLIDASRSEATSEALIHDGDGRLLTHATTRCFLQTVEPTDAVPHDYFEEGPYETPDPYERPLPAELVSTADLSDLSGLEVVRRIADGTLPAPVNSLLGGSSVSQDVEFGRVTRTYPATPWYTSPSGTIYGGLLANLADALSTAAATTTLEAGTGMASLDLKVHFLRPGIADGSTLVGHGEVLHGGKGLIVTRSEVCNASGKPVVGRRAP